MKEMKALTAHLRKSMGYAEKILDEMWQEMMNRQFGKSSQRSEEAAEYRFDLQSSLADHLRPLGDDFAIALEIMGLPETRRDFLEKWSKFDDKALRETKEEHNDYGDFVVSAPLGLCWSILHLIEAPYESETASSEKASLEILDFILQATGKIVKNANAIPPTKENDIQKAMHAHLATNFASFTSQLVISKPIKSFKPDCGIVDLGAAIEFKFVDNQDELKVATSGLNEDLSGYAGSRDWTRFYTVIYQTGCYGTEKQIQKMLRMSGNADRWQIHLVTGDGGRKKKGV